MLALCPLSYPVAFLLASPRPQLALALLDTDSAPCRPPLLVPALLLRRPPSRFPLSSLHRLLCLFLIVDPPERCCWVRRLRGGCVVCKVEYEAGCTGMSVHAYMVRFTSTDVQWRHLAPGRVRKDRRREQGEDAVTVKVDVRWTDMRTW